MADTREDVTRGESEREAIDSMLRQVGQLIEKNNLAALRLRGVLLGESPEEETPISPPPHPGWLGEVVNALGIMRRHSSSTAELLRELHQQMSPQEPAPV